jgi:hypothetical protein
LRDWLGNEQNPDANGAPVAIWNSPGTDETTMRIPNPDPGELWTDINMQLFGNPAPTPGQEPTMDACHNAPNAKQFAGGLPFKLPFGTIYSTNITADRETGIGSWSDDDFVRALHRGIAPGGRYLYPAFPYTSFTAMSRDDALAIKAYLFSLPPQHVANQENDLSFPPVHCSQSHVAVAAIGAAGGRVRS